MPHKKRKKSKTSHQQKNRNEPSNHKQNEARALFLRNVFDQYCQVQKFHFKWFRLQDLVQNINNYFYIEASLAVTKDDLTYNVFRQRKIVLGLEMGKSGMNGIGFYRGHCVEGKHEVPVYQSTPIGAKSQNSPNSVEREALFVSSSERKPLTGSSCNASGQKKLITLLQLPQTSDNSSVISDLSLSSNSDCAHYDASVFSTEALHPWWFEEKAHSLFTPQADREPYEEVVSRIEILQKALMTSDGYKEVIEIIGKGTSKSDDKQEDDDKLTDYQIYCVRQRSMYLIAALKYAKENMPTWTWERCCRESINDCNKNVKGTRLEYSKNGRMVENWHRIFRKSNKFPIMVLHPKALPFFLEENPDALRLIIKYGTSNLSTLSGELIFHYIHEKIIPAMIRFRKVIPQNMERSLSDYISEEK
jgi:hypothetical protein